MQPTIAARSKRQQITEAAARLFKTRGYVATTMRDIAEHVGMEAASLYNHIKSKDDILQAICFEFAHAYTAQLDEIVQTDLPMAQKIEAVIDLHITLSTDAAEAVIITNHEWQHLAEPHRSTFKVMRKRYERTLSDLLAQGIARGEWQALDPQIAMFTLLSALRWIPFWYQNHRGASVEMLRQNVKQLLMNGLTHPENTRH